MCLAVPGRVIRHYGDEAATADVEFGVVTRSVCLACVPEAAVGDYVIVHAGFAIARLDEAAAQRSLELLQELAAAGSAAALPPATVSTPKRPAAGAVAGEAAGRAKLP